LSKVTLAIFLEGEAPRWCPGVRAHGSGLSAGCGSCPPPSVSDDTLKSGGYPRGVCTMKRKRPEKQEPSPPGEDVVEKLDPDHSDEDFLSDLEKASSDQARKKLGLPSERDRGSTRTSE
jgi:hypothetical protein